MCVDRLRGAKLDQIIVANITSDPGNDYVSRAPVLGRSTKLFGSHSKPKKLAARTNGCIAEINQNPEGTVAVRSMATE